MRVMLDTNILVSAFVFRSRRFYTAINELKDVVWRKFPKMAGELDEFLTTLSFTLAYSPQHIPTGLFAIRDISDVPVLYTAIIESVDVLVTGDKDFDDIKMEKPAIMTVVDFENEYMKI